MEGADPHPRGVGPEHPGDARLHLARGLVGERHREDAVGRHTVMLDQVGDAGRQHPGLARPRAGQDEDRSLEMLHGLALVVI